jgi:signal transduction histidine kinase
MRLVQEALDNVVRHAEGAHAAGFELRLLEERSQRSLCLRISDDGRGKPEGRRAEATARGIALMERLASDLGAPLAIGPARPGWVVDLTLKL